MKCNGCKYKDECPWFNDLQQIKQNILLQIGTDNPMGHSLIQVIENEDIGDCEEYQETEEK